jgi:hypothetical protein
MGRRSLVAAALLLCACETQSSGPIRLKAMTPAQGEDEAPVAVEIAGESFGVRVHTDFKRSAQSFVTASFKASLLPVDGAQPPVELEEVSLDSPELLRAVVPRGAGLGFYSLRVVDPFGGEGVLPEVFRVVRSAKGLAGFRVDNLGPQRVNVPFTLQIVAVDREGRTVDGFAGNVSLRDRTGTITPSVAGPAILGRIRTIVSLGAFAGSNVIEPSDGKGHQGKSNDFAVVPGLAVGTTFVSHAPILSAGQCSPRLEMDTLDTFGQRAMVEAPMRVRLAAPPDRFAFYADPACSAPVSEIVVPAATTRAGFHVRGERAGSFPIRAIPDVLPVAGLTVSITPLPPTRLKLVSPPQSLRVQQCSGPFTVGAFDPLDNESAPKAPLAVALSSQPPRALVLYADERCSQEAASLTFPGEATRVTFFAKPAQAGTASVSATPQAPSTLSGASQSASVAP